MSLLDASSSSVSTRRDVFRNVLLSAGGIVASSVLVGAPEPSFAASVPSPKELEKLQLGHARVQYLLKNWDSITESCNNKAMSSVEAKQVVRTENGGGGFCDKTPLRVQEYLGYSSTLDPLYKVDKLMLRAAPLVEDDQEGFVEIIETYREKADMTNLMAYTSSWGEANPNGGKEVVDDYLEQTRQIVLSTEQLLRTALKYLNLEVLPPSDRKS